MQTTAEILDDMARLVRAGRLGEAVTLGRRCSPPLHVAPDDIRVFETLGSGSESTILASEYRGQPVAYKKARVRGTDDLERFRREVALLAELQHDSVVPLLAAHALPPAYAMVLPRYATSLEVCPR